jgi:geranylgeranyl pyrophosphate synthase
MENIYTQTLNLLFELPLIQKWPEMQAILTETSKRRPPVWQMPVLACEAVGGNSTLALPAVVTIGSMHLSLVVTDDLLDEEPNGYGERYGGVGRAANLASALQAVAGIAIVTSPASPSVRLAALSSLHEVLLATARGQDLDCQNPADEEAYWHAVRLKSSPYFGAALYMGALFGGAPLSLALELRDIGMIYGEIVQIKDDLNDSLAVPANSDWIQGRSSLPLLFAQVVEHPERTRFCQLRQLISGPESDEAALLEAQQILLRSGAISYCVDQLLRRYKKACQKLATIPLVQRTSLTKWLEELVQPVWSLFKAMGFKERLAMAM